MKSFSLNNHRVGVSFGGRLSYYRRVFEAYLLPQKSHLTFWHGVPELNQRFRLDELADYYMPFTAKANYQGQYDRAGIPLLNYHGKVGLQYNPIAIAHPGNGGDCRNERMLGSIDRAARPVLSDVAAARGRGP